MDKARLEVKVGLFVLAGMVLLAVLLIQFSKGTTFFRGTYELRMHAGNVGGLKKGAAVLLRGVQVGEVSSISLREGATNVVVRLRIYSNYDIYRGDSFVIEQSGFLGDQYVAVNPAGNTTDKLKNGDEVQCQEPFNLQEVARAASGFIQRIDETARQLNAAVRDVRRLVLNEQTLSNFSATVGNMRLASDHALTTVDNINTLVESNRPSISGSVSNLVYFSQEINRLAGAFGGVLATNSTDISAAVKNVESSTEVMKKLVDDLQAGKGVAGNLLRNDAMANDVATILNNLAVTTSNLNRLGLWGILWAHKPPRTNEPSAKALTAPHQLTP